jgi:anion-transporting  ArsA/GET3 family ATPase
VPPDQRAEPVPSTASPGRADGARASAPRSLLDLRLVFVTGKGGVGKTTVAAALAQLAARRGRRVLACEVDAKGDLAALFEAAPTDFDGREVEPGIVVMSMDTEASLREYLKLYLRLPVPARLGPLARVFDFVAAAAPGVREILTVGKLAYEVRERRYDLIVVDASASGHIVSQLSAPQAINDLVKVGLIRTQTDWMLEILSDPGRTGVVVVTTPEEMPVAETLELSDRIAAETTVRLSGVVVNRVLPELFGRHEEQVFDRLYAERAQLSKLLAGDVEPVMEGARLAVTMRRTRAGHLQRLREGLEASHPVPVLYVPYLFTRGHGLRTTGQVATALGEELGL